MASVHLVKRPAITKIYLFPCFVSGSGPKISIATLSISSPEIYVPSGALFVSLFLLVFVQSIDHMSGSIFVHNLSHWASKILF